MRAGPVRVRDPEVLALLDELTAELALGGYPPDQSFGYSAEQLERSSVALLGVRADGRLVGVGGLETQDDGVGELKRFYVRPDHRGSGVADALVSAVVDLARVSGLTSLRLETGDVQHAAIALYRRHGFVVIPRFGPYVDSASSVCLQREL